MRRYPEEFLRTEYGAEAAAKILTAVIVAIDRYEKGGVSQAAEDRTIIAVKG